MVKEPSTVRSGKPVTRTRTYAPSTTNSRPVVLNAAASTKIRALERISKTLLRTNHCRAAPFESFHIQAELFCDGCIDEQVSICDDLYRQVCWLGPLEDLDDQLTRQITKLGHVDRNRQNGTLFHAPRFAAKQWFMSFTS